MVVGFEWAGLGGLGGCVSDDGDNDDDDDHCEKTRKVSQERRAGGGGNIKINNTKQKLARRDS